MFNVKRFDFDDQETSNAVVKSTDRDGGRLARIKQAAAKESERLELLHQQASERKQRIEAQTAAAVAQEAAAQLREQGRQQGRQQQQQQVTLTRAHDAIQKRARDTTTIDTDTTTTHKKTKVTDTSSKRASRRKQRAAAAENTTVDPLTPVAEDELKILAAGGRIFIPSIKTSAATTMANNDSSSTSNTTATTSTSTATTTTSTSTAPSSSTVPSLKVDGKEWGLDKRLVKALKHAYNVKQFFPIQRRALPLILRGDVSVGGLHEDVCVSAPTGSGKTLVFAIAVLQTLKDRVVRRLRALVVLPSRELAVQVHAVFDKLCPSLQLQCALAVSGRTSFAIEQPSVLACDVLICTPGRLLEHLRSTATFTLEHLKMLVVDEADRLLSQSYQRWVQVVLERSTQSQSRGTFALPKKENGKKGGDGGDAYINKGSECCPRYHIVPRTYRGMDSYDAAHTSSLFDGRVRKLLFSATLTTNPQQLSSLELLNPRFISMEDTTPDFAAHVYANTAGTRKNGHRSDPVASRLLSRPFRTPDTLHERVMPCTTETKPLLLSTLVREIINKQNKTTSGSRKNKSKILIFTGTVKNTHRLCRLLQIVETLEKDDAKATLPPSSSSSSSSSSSEEDDKDTHHHARTLLPRLTQTSIREYSSSVPAKQRAGHLQQFSRENSQCQVLVCSDAGARGLDIEHVTDVINYDVPTVAKVYIHRVGRTARAGRHGTSYTLLKPGQIGNYHAMMRSITHNTVRVYPIRTKNVEQLQNVYRRSLTRLKQVMELEQDE